MPNQPVTPVSSDTIRKMSKDLDKLSVQLRAIAESMDHSDASEFNVEGVSTAAKSIESLGEVIEKCVTAVRKSNE